MRRDKFLVHPAVLDEQVRDAVEQREVGLRRDRQVQRRGHRGLGGARVEHDDFRRTAVAQHALPHDGMRHARVRADEDEDVRLLEVRVGERRRVEAESLLVGDGAGGHALARVRVAMQRAHAALPERAEERHLLRANLARAQERDALLPVLVHDGLELQREDLHRVVPVGRLQVSGGGIAQERRGGAVLCD